VRAPDELRALEPAARERIAARAQRGKMELSLRFRSDTGPAGPTCVVNQSLLARLADLALDCEARFPKLQVEFTELLRYPGVVEIAEVDQAELQRNALALLDETIDEFGRARARRRQARRGDARAPRRHRSDHGAGEAMAARNPCRAAQPSSTRSWAI
jgi:uncharacterized protein (TIGR00255 family)